MWWPNEEPFSSSHSYSSRHSSHQVYDDEPRPFVPRFIQMLTASQKERFDAIWMSPEIPEKQKHQQLEAFALKEFNQQQMDDFKIWLTDMKRQQAAIDARIAKLSQPAKAFYDKLIEVRKNEGRLMRTLTPQLQDELAGLI